MKRWVSAVSIVLAVYVLMSGLAYAQDNKDRSLEILCAGAMMPPVEELSKIFEKQNRVKVQISYAPSEIMLQQIKLRPHGDVFIPADKYYTEKGIKAGLIESPKTIAYLIPVIMVQKGNPHNITRLSDLTKNEVKVGLVDERIGAIGRLFVQLLKKNKIKLDDINVVYHAPMVSDLANAVKLKTVDAAVVWKSLAMSFPKESDYISIPRSQNIIVSVSAGVIKSSSNKDLAKKFLNLMTSKTGKTVFTKHHYPVEKP